MKKFLVLAGSLLATSAFAALSTSAAVSKKKVDPTMWEMIKKNTGLVYFAEANDASMEPTESEKENQGYFFQSFSGRYQLNKTWSARLDLRFQTTEGLSDPYDERNVRVGFQGVSYASGNVSVFTLVRFEGATTDAAKDDKKIIRPMVYNAANYSTGANSISLGVQFAKWLYEEGSEVPGMGNFMDLTYRYTFTDKLAFQLYTELGLDSRAGKDLTDVANTWERHLIGADIKVAKNISFYPHFDYRPHNGEDKQFSDVGVGAWITGFFFP